MSAKSNDQGRAYEYAWMEALYIALGRLRKTEVVRNSSLLANQRSWGAVPEDMRRLFRLSAQAAIKTLLELEPRMDERANDALTLEFQIDQAGTRGDVRDIVIKRDNIAWEIGLSIKHNHDAVKHSRLSATNDFGREWYDVNCSNAYWADIEGIFDMLKKEQVKGTKWSELPNKEDNVYVPILQAFIKEVNRAYSVDRELPRKMLEYLIGVKDYYKVVSHDDRSLTMIHTFNVHGTLNKPGKIRVSAVTVPIVELPTKLIALQFKENSKSTVEMYLNNGWQLSFRIHNASTKVEGSLKFDIRFIGVPVSILNIECRWN